MEPANREDLIDLLIRQEELVGEFYRACAGKFPERSDVWLSLAVAEDGHARILRSVAADPAEGRAFTIHRNFALNPLRFMLQFVKKQTEALESPGFTLINALSIARDIENSILEKKVVEPAPGDSADIRAKIEQLKAETTQHRIKITETLAERMR